MNEKNTRDDVFVDYDLFKTKYMITYFDIYPNISQISKNTSCKTEFRYVLSQDHPITSLHTFYAMPLDEDISKISVITDKTEIIQ